MSPAEIAGRALSAVRDRLAPPRWSKQAPADAFRTLFDGDGSRALRESRLSRWLAVPAEPAGLSAAIGDAERLLAGRATIFGREVTIGERPAWNRNPFSGAAWPDAPSATLDYRRIDTAGGAKDTWELGRLTMLPTLALASRLTGDDAAARLAVHWLDDFNTRNPLGHGIHHTSGIEMAIRVMTACATLALLGDEGPRPDLEATLGLIAQQALWCRDHPSLGSSANNHLLAELSAIVIAGSLYPTLEHGATRARAAHRALERQVLAQFHSDGVNAEQSFGYLPFIAELLLLAFRAAEAAGLATSRAVRERLARALEFARVIRLPGGGWPQIGDEDDGRILLAGDAHSRLDLTMNALAAWLGAVPLSEDAGGLRALLIREAAMPAAQSVRAAHTTHGVSPLHAAHAVSPLPAAHAADGRHDYPEGGWTVWRERGVLLTFDHGPLGLGSIAAHGHADALAITLFRGDDGLIVDPGTLAYHEDPIARDRCRSTPVHSTIHFGGRSQSEMLGPFLWGRRARLAREGGAWRCTWWTGERHTRQVRVDGERITLEDATHGANAELVFALAPGATVVMEGTRALIRSGGSRAELRMEGVDALRLEAAEHGVRFGQRAASNRLCARLLGTRALTEIRVGPA